MKTKYLVILIIFSTSCKPENKGLIEFDPRTLEENKITLSEIADEITYISLDNSFLIDLIYKNIKFTKNSIYFSTKDNGILAFNRGGKFIRKIGSFGRGPGEYVYCYAIDVDTENETIYNMDQNTIKIYSKTGDFLRSISLQEFGDNVDSFEIFNSKLFVFYKIQWAGFKYEWIVLDTLGNLIKKKASTIPDFTCEWGDSWLTYRYDNAMSYWNPFTDTVFSFLPDLKNKVSFIISPGDHRMPRSKIYSFENYNKYLHPKRFLESNRFLVIIFSYKKPALVLIDKYNSGSFLTRLEGDDSGDALFLTGGVINDFDGGLRFLPKSYFVENGREFMFGLINCYQIKTHIASNEFKNSTPKYPEKKKEFEKLANSLKETDNPVFMIVRLKK